MKSSASMSTSRSCFHLIYEVSANSRDAKLFDTAAAADEVEIIFFSLAVSKLTQLMILHF